MPNRLLSWQLPVLFVSSLIVLFVGMGLFPILPIYATQFGASKTGIGIYFAVMYASNALGATAPAWLADRVRLRTLFVAGSALGLPALLLLSVLPMPRLTVARAIRIVRYYQRRNYAAYLSHRKGRVQRLSVNLAL